MNYTPSREDYLISLYLLREKRGSVRSLDIVQMLGYSKPSVSNGLRLLRQNDLVWMDDQKFLSLTPEGERRLCRKAFMHPPSGCFFLTFT